MIGNFSNFQKRNSQMSSSNIFKFHIAYLKDVIVYVRIKDFRYKSTGCDNEFPKTKESAITRNLQKYKST